MAPPCQMRPYKILIVEDDSDMRLLTRLTLEHGGYQVIEAQDGFEGLEMACAASPHLVLLDVALPDMAGFEVCRRLRAAPDTEHLPVVFLTAHNDQANRTQGFLAGGDDYLTKPIRPAELIRRLEAFLEQAEMWPERRRP